MNRIKRIPGGWSILMRHMSHAMRLSLCVCMPLISNETHQNDFRRNEYSKSVPAKITFNWIGPNTKTVNIYSVRVSQAQTHTHTKKNIKWCFVSVATISFTDHFYCIVNKIDILRFDSRFFFSLPQNKIGIGEERRKNRNVVRRKKIWKETIGDTMCIRYWAFGVCVCVPKIDFCGFVCTRSIETRMH